MRYFLQFIAKVQEKTAEFQLAGYHTPSHWDLRRTRRTGGQLPFLRVRLRFCPEGGPSLGFGGASRRVRTGNSRRWVRLTFQTKTPRINRRPQTSGVRLYSASEEEQRTRPNFSSAAGASHEIVANGLFLKVGFRVGCSNRLHDQTRDLWSRRCAGERHSRLPGPPRSRSSGA